MRAAVLVVVVDAGVGVGITAGTGAAATSDGAGETSTTTGVEPGEAEVGLFGKAQPATTRANRQLKEKPYRALIPAPCLSLLYP